MRIASLVPSATETLFALGLGPDVVGVTHECDYPPEAAYAGPPLVAFIADRRVPANQPDAFILRAEVHDEVREAQSADQPVCR